MSKDISRWWNVPKLPSFSLWRMSNPTDDQMNSVPDTAVSGDTHDATLRERTPDSLAGDTNGKVRSLRSSSRSRSSSTSIGSQRSASLGRESSLADELSAMPQINFSFFNDRDDEYVIVGNTILESSEIEKVQTGKCKEKGDDSDADLSFGSTTDNILGTSSINKTTNVEDGPADCGNLDDEGGKLTDATENKRHVSHLTLIISDPEKNSEVEHDYAVLKGETEDKVEPPYSAPNNLLVGVPIYAIVDKKKKEVAPEVPPPDWTPPNEPDYAELKPPEEALEYCQHREDLRPSLRRVTLLRTRRKSIRVRSRIGKAWTAVKSWWLEERIRLGEVILRHAHGQAVVLPEPVNGEEVEEVVGDVEEITPDADDADYVGLALSDTLSCDQESIVTSATTPRPSHPHLAKRRTGRPSSRASRLSRIFTDIEGQSGFDELRRYIKQGGDFCKDLSSILQERSDAEAQYAKTLAKLSGKLLKASKESVGTVNQAWQRAGVEMETESEIHRAFAAALSEEVVKPLRQLLESQHRIRKSVETAVDKTGKSLCEWRAAESKAKKQSFGSARENEKLQDAMLDTRINTNGKLSASSLHLHSPRTALEKDSSKVDSKRRKAEESVKKADVEYYAYCIRAERARLEWETAVLRGGQCFQALEEERLQHLRDIALCYSHHYRDMGPKLVQSSDRLAEPIESCSVSQDLTTVINLKCCGNPVPEQLLPDFYAEHITLAMNKERRRQALVKILQLIRQDLERERRGKQGVENLARALKQTPNFTTEDSQQNVTEKLHHMRSMLTYLEAARYKVQSALAELEGRPKGSHPLASHIQITRDRQGLQQSLLKVPQWIHKEAIDIGDTPDWNNRGAGDGNSMQRDSDFDEFSSQGSERDYQSSAFSALEETQSQCAVLGSCKALYHYAANLYDELTLNPGDVINIHDKQADGWWLGELNGVVGIFPATYVEETKN